MADYFEHTCIGLPVRNKRARAWWKKVQEALEDIFNDDSPRRKFLTKFIPEAALDGTVCAIEFEGDAVYLTDDGGVLNTDGIEAILQEYLRKFDPEGIVALEVAFTCSKAKIDAYGGYVSVITATEVRGESTHTMRNTLLNTMGLDPTKRRDMR